MQRGQRGACVALLCAAAVATGAGAHETDQFTVPLGKEFADVGDYLTEMYCEGIEAGVKLTNQRIRRAMAAGRQDSYIQYLKSPETVTANVYEQYTAAVFMIDGVDRQVHRDAFMLRYPGRVTGYWESIHNVFTGIYFPLDPRQLFRIWHASTMRAFGVYFGPDKLGHFTDMGYLYYRIHRTALANGCTEAEAHEQVMTEGSGGLVFGERGMLGYLSSGVYSNADLSSNYCGMKFYLNMTEPVRLKGRWRPPMVVRDGDFWRVADHVGRDSDFLSWFISDHWNEALNPGLVLSGMREKFRENVRRRSSRILDFYVDENGNRRTKAWFDRTQQALTTYWGEDYGHQGSEEELVTIGNTCFEAPGASGVNAAGYTRLHWGAMTGDRALALEALEAGVPVDAPVRSREQSSAEWGSTALHLAAAAGHAEVAALLLDHGADVNRRDDRGATPLHRAVEHPELIELLAARGADPDARDQRGRSPLHWLAASPAHRGATALIARGADVDARDHNGETPLHIAAMGGRLDLVGVLLEAGADPDARARFGTTPLHFAARQRDPHVIAWLAGRGADLDAADEFGMTPLHEAARLGHRNVAWALLSNGAAGDAADAEGATPLHVAARHGHEAVAAALLEWGVDVNPANGAGSEPLHEAVFAGRTTLINLLLEHGADPGARNARGESPIEAASASGQSVAAVMMDAASLPRRGERPAAGLQ